MIRVKRAKKFLAGLTMLVLTAALLSTTALAASYPIMMADELEYTVTQGETVELKFSILHEYKNEEAHIRVHKGSKDGPVVASSDRTFYNTNHMTDYTVTWDTTGEEPGTYVVENWMSFYSFMEWHDEPTHDTIVRVHVKAAPCQNGHTFNAGEVTKEPTCSKEGTLTKTCTACGATEKQSIPTTQHPWGGGKVESAATYTMPGTMIYTCTSCKATRSEVIPATFTDVDAGAYYASAVDWAADNKVTSGTSADTFAPALGCDRAQVLTFLWRAMGSPEPSATENPFADVPEHQYYYKPVLWGVEKGITSGTSATTFSPNTKCSFAQILTFIWRSQNSPNATGQGAWYADALAWADLNGILDETGAQTDINADCPRSDVVTFLYRILDEEAKKELGHSYGEWTVTLQPTCSAQGSKTRQCTICGKTQTRTMAAVPHSLSQATCTEAPVCSVCGMTTGTAKGHTWINATCTTPKMCSVCWTGEGEPLGHTTSKGICGRCGQEISEPIVFSGTGDKIITGVDLPEGLYKISLSHTGESNFIVVPYHGTGDRESSWSNEIGNYSGSVVFNEALNNGYLEVNADGNWTISIQEVSGTCTSNFSGTGDYVSNFFTLPAGIQVVKMNYVGNSNFIVCVYDDTGRRYSSLANEIDSYSGEVIFNRASPDRKYCIEVVGEGSWTIDFGLGEAVTTCIPGK